MASRESEDFFSMHALVAIGRAESILRYPAQTDPHFYRQVLDELSSRIEDVPQLSGSLGVAESFKEAPIEYNTLTKRITKEDVPRLKALAHTLGQLIDRELSGLLALPILQVEHHLFDPVFESWPENLLCDYHQALRSDIQTMMAARQYRQAIVAGWMLAYDLIRAWVFGDQDRLSDFNDLLGSRTSNHRRGSRSISLYDDFFSESESFVLEVCRDAGNSLSGFTSKTHRALEVLLDDRNAYAHASYKDASRSRAESFIEKLADILTSPPFPSDVRLKRSGQKPPGSPGS